MPMQQMPSGEQHSMVSTWTLIPCFPSICITYMVTIHLIRWPLSSPFTDFCRAAPCHKKLSDISHCLRAWDIYEHLLHDFIPNRYLELAWYRNFMMQMAKVYDWQAVHQFDMHHMTHVASFKAPFHQINSSIRNSILCAASVKANKPWCFCFGSVDHNVANCTFPGGSQW